ncbi:MAG TPA: response regulator [Chloroflexota bacterium]|nr:response regulator [Chloroflexota bacterium]
MMEEEPRTILVIEDDADLRAAMRWALEMVGYAVTTANNGFEALKVVEQHSPDLILLDMHMPLMDGREFAQELRKSDHSEIPLVFVTASTESRETGEIGAVAWVRKPFDLASLIGTVKKHARQTSCDL